MDSDRPAAARTETEKSPMELFSSITIHGLANSPDGQPVPYTLERGTSFPPQLFIYASKAQFEWPFDMSPQTVPSSGMHLELELSDFIERGRCGHVYEVRVIGVSARPDLPTSPPNFPLPPLCIKLAEPNRLRCIAREAWFYEKLGEGSVQGTAVPRGFGFYTAQCALSQVIPWRERNWEYHDEVAWVRRFLQRRGYSDESALRTLPPDSPVWTQLDDAEVDRHDWLKLEPEEDREDFADDEKGSNMNSIWKHWAWKICDPQDIGIIVMEKLGPGIEGNCHNGKLDKEQGKEVRAVLHDVLSAKIFHYYDVRPEQFVEATTSEICPRHGYAHKWRVLDFDRCNALSSDPLNLRRAAEAIERIPDNTTRFYFSA
ncbi:hypothetical protein K474DRAFT_1666110 [Panus rudis PR-1116 ss-1]|nr:hypothetical protein K474DRAFT_1666110 [Panus rudis PR-1116 ss-1]